MKKIILVFVVAAIWSGNSEAHRFSTSFLTLKTGAETVNETDWSWQLAEHDLQTLMPELNEDEKVTATNLSEAVADWLAFGSGCSVEVVALSPADGTVFGGQHMRTLYGHAHCPLQEVTEVRVNEVWQDIGDHQVILEVEGLSSEQPIVLRENQPHWSR